MISKVEKLLLIYKQYIYIRIFIIYNYVVVIYQYILYLFHIIINDYCNKRLNAIV